MPPKRRILHKDTLPFERKNQDMIKLPKHARVQKRPIPHAPAASPYAGSSVPKTVYVSTKTPFMSAVKRVQKLLRQVERRALDGSGVTDPRASERERLARLEKGQESIGGAGREEVFVKATGRAMEKALSVGRWFEAEERAGEFAVRVKTGCVLVVDDVVEDEELKRRIVEEGGRMRRELEQGESQGSGKGGEAPAEKETGLSQVGEDGVSLFTSSGPSDAPVSKSASKKMKRTVNAAAAADDELPESRTRWVNMVEIAVSLK